MGVEPDPYPRHAIGVQHAAMGALQPFGAVWDGLPRVGPGRGLRGRAAGVMPSGPVPVIVEGVGAVTGGVLDWGARVHGAISSAAGGTR